MHPELARDSVEWMRRQSAETQAEVYLTRSEDRVLARREGETDAVETAEESGAAVRVARDGRVGFASAGGAGAAELRELYRRALEQLPQSAGGLPPLPEPGPTPRDAQLEASLLDEALFSRSWDELGERLAAAEAAAAKAGKGARALRSEWSEERGETVIASTGGLLAVERGGSASVSVTAAAQDGAEVLLGEAHRSSRRLGELSPEDAGREAGERAAFLVGAGRAKGGRRAVLFEPWVAVEFLELLSELLSAEEAQAGRSLLAGRLGKRVASPLVSLLDRPRLPGGLASAAFDDEGVPTADRAMVEKGTLRAFFHDAATAARAGEKPNGCGWRGSYADRPGPGPSNFLLQPGAISREKLLASSGEALLVGEVLGMHMVDPVSGAFSVGVSGRSLTGGVPGRGFKGAMISGNLLELLERVDGVASDLRWQGGLGAPTFRVSELDVA